MDPVAENTVKKSLIFTWLKRLFYTGLILILLFIGAITVVTVFFADEVKQRIVVELNKHLAAPVSVKEVDFSVWKKFPFASVEFKEVVIDDVLRKNTNHKLLKAERFFVTLNLLDILNKKYKVRSMEVENGMIDLYFDASGNGNYKFWKESSTGNRESAVITLKKIALLNVKLNYASILNDQYYNFDIHTLLFAGQFADKEYSLQTTGSAFCKKLVIGGIKYIRNKEIKVDTELDVKKENNWFNFKKGLINVANLGLDASGTLEFKGGNTDYNLSVKGYDLNITSLLTALPGNYKEQLENYESDGEISLQATVKGLASSKRAPLVNVTFNIKDGEFTYKSTGLTLKDIQLNGNYTNGEKRNNATSVLNLKKFSAALSNGRVNGVVKISNFDQPVAEGHSEMNFPLGDLLTFMHNDTLYDVSGNMKADIQFSWPLKSEASVKSIAENYKTSGTINFRDAAFNIKHKLVKVGNLQAELSFDNSDIKINQVSLNINKSDARLSGYFENIIPYLLGNSSRLAIGANVKSNKLDLDELLAYQASEAASVADTVYRLIFPSDVSFDIDATVGETSFRRFKAQQLSGNFKMKHRKLMASDVRFLNGEGEVQMNALLDGADTTKINYVGEVNMKNVDLNRLFFQLENFGQNYLTEKNIKGTLSTNVQIKASFSNSLVINTKSVYARAEMQIEKGELINYETMLALSKFIEVSELKHIKFATLNNTIEIKDETVIIPAMEIKSNALNITAAGTHTFNQYLDYRFRVALKDLLARKAKVKPQNEEFGEVEEETKGINLFISVKGPIDNLKFSYDKKGFKDKMKQDFTSEKNTVKALLKEEFGLFKKDTSLKVVKEEKNIKPVILEWEEEKKPGSESDDATNKKRTLGDTKKKEGADKPKKENILDKTINKGNKKEETQNVEDIQ